MEAQFAALLAVDPTEWVVRTDGVRSSTLILLTLVALGALVGALVQFGVVGGVLWAAGVVIRNGIRAGFGVWKRWLAWAPWPLFLAAQLVLIAAGVATARLIPGVAAACAVGLLGMGLAACLAYMFVDVERYEVARGHKALHDPMKGQRLAVELARYGHQVGVPLLASAAVGMIGGFALLNFALFRMLGPAWYTPPTADVTYPDFVASALVHLLSVVNLLNLADTHHLVRVGVVRPAAAPATALLGLFKSFFTLVSAPTDLRLGAKGAAADGDDRRLLESARADPRAGQGRPAAVRGRGTRAAPGVPPVRGGSHPGTAGATATGTRNHRPVRDPGPAALPRRPERTRPGRRGLHARPAPGWRVP